MSLGKRLKKAREDKNLTQTKVSKDTNINNKTLSGYERGISEPDLETIKKLAKYYDVSLDYLLGNSDIKNSTNEYDLSQEELEILEQIKSDPEISILFHDLKSAPKKKIKQLIETWAFINKTFDDMEDDK